MAEFWSSVPWFQRRRHHPVLERHIRRHAIAPIRRIRLPPDQRLQVPARRRGDAEAVAADPPYRILRADNRAHIVENKKTGCIYYALFEAVRDERPSSLFLGCSKPLLLLIQLSEDQKTATLRLCDPDLRLCEGIDPEQYDTQGRRKELSIYSRPWRNHPSRPAEATLLIRGLWDTTDCTAEHEEDATRLSIVLQDALNYEIRLER